VFVTWGALCWLPDIAGWAAIVAHFLRPGGALYFADDHPVASVFADETGQGGMPGWYAPYFRDGLVEEDGSDYADHGARLANARTHQWLHPLGTVVDALLGAGLRLDGLHEHAALPWRRYACLAPGADGLYRWPDKPWLPLAFSLSATKAQ
jgi:hypothetical protein